MIVIATVTQDLHAQHVKAVLDVRQPRLCRIIELDRLAQTEAISYAIGSDAADEIVDCDNEVFSVSDATVLWLRRVPRVQSLRESIEDQHTREVISNDCRGAALGLLRTKFRGKWISSIEATALASDKIAQLEVARVAGFRIPKTIVTQSAQAVSRFAVEYGPLIVKSVVGAAGPMLQTVRIDDPSVYSVEEYRASPAIYQEYIAGTDHLRLVAFGDISYAGRIRTNDVDWRGNLNVPVEAVQVDTELNARVWSVLRRLGLEMGVVDLKIAASGEPVWLEVNPQGQFAFLDGLANMKLIDAFAAYLATEASFTATEHG